MYYQHSISYEHMHILKYIRITYIGESKRIRILPEYGYSRYLRNHKYYKIMLINNICIII